MKQLHLFLLSRLLAISISLVMAASVQAQGGETLVKVQLRVKEVGVNDLAKRINPVFKFLIGGQEGTLINDGGICYKFSSKSGTNSFNLLDPKYLGWSNLQSFTVPILSRSSFILNMTCFSNDKGDACTYDKKDDYFSTTNFHIDLNKFTPGDVTDTFYIRDTKNQFWSLIEFRYTLVPPARVKTRQATSEVNNADSTIALQSGYPLYNRGALKFGWEYSLDKGGSWNRLEGQNSNPFNIEINPNRDLFEQKLATTAPVWFRFRVNSRDTFAFSDTIKTKFTAPPPMVAKEDIKVVNTCKGYEGGSISLNHIKSAGNRIAYILRKKIKDGSNCDLGNASAASCPGYVKGGIAESGTLSFSNLAADNYELLMYNPGMEVGNVFYTVPLRVETYAGLAVQSFEFFNPTCKDDNGGKILLHAEGGSDPGLWEINLKPFAGSKELDLQQKRIVFKNLPEGTYALEVQDGCGEQIVKQAILRKPEKLLVETIKVRTSPQLALIVNLKNGSGTYMVNFTDHYQSVRREENLTNLTFLIPEKGTYRIQIFDKADPECLTIDTTYTVVTQLKAHRGRQKRNNFLGAKEEALLVSNDARRLEAVLQDGRRRIPAGKRATGAR